MYKRQATTNLGSTTTIRTLLPGLSSFKLADSPTDTDLSHPSYQRLMTAGSQVNSLGIDQSSLDSRLQLANQLYIANQVVDRSNQTLTSILDQNCLTKLSDKNRKNFVLKPSTHLSVFEQETVDKNLVGVQNFDQIVRACLLYTSPSPRDGLLSRMPSSA